MQLHPVAEQHLALRRNAGERPYLELPPVALREQSERIGKVLGASAPRVGLVHSLPFEVSGARLHGRLYKSHATMGLARPVPLLVMIHGGGWVVGSPATHDGFCRTLAQASGCVVFSPDYRKAPEWRYPVAAYDAYAALEFAAAHAQAWGADPEAVFVGGNSAGANLAAVCALLARDRSGPSLKGQLLMVPALDPSCASASFEENREAPILTAATMRWFWDQYLSGPHDADQPYASPVRARLDGLPAALIQTAQYDPLRDEGLAYAQALSSAGVRVQHRVYEGMVHTALGPQAVSDLCAFVHAA